MIENGDIFYLPLNLDATFEKGKRRDGAYLPKGNDTVTFGQIIELEDKEHKFMLFDLVCKQKEVSSITLETITSQDVFLSLDMIDVAIRSKWWPIIGNQELSKSLPMQAYRTMGLAEPGKLHQICDYRGENIKYVPYEVAQYLPNAGTSVTPGYFRSISRFHFGLESTLFDLSSEVFGPNSRGYTPHPKSLVWNVYPELYKNAWEVFDH